MRKILLTGMMLAACCGMTAQVEAQTTLVVPGANADMPGTNNANTPFGAAGSASLYVLQEQFASSLFSNVAIGSQLTSIGIRLYTGAATNSKELDYTNFEIQVGTGANAMGSLSRTFSANLGADTIVARSGALTIAKNGLKADSCTSRRKCSTIVPTNSFYTLDFTTPYTYEGGDLLITFSSQLAANTIGQVISLDAVDPYAVSTINTMSTSGSGSAFPTIGGPLNFSFAPIVQFDFAAPQPAAAVPEPASWALMVGGFGLAGAAMRRRRVQSATA